jgi:hypothetical protein
MKQQMTQVAEISVSYRPAITNKPSIKWALDAYVATELPLKSFFPFKPITIEK